MSEHNPPISRREWLCPATIAAVLVACCYFRSAKQPPWFDEVISWTLINDNSVVHMIRALAHGADGMPPLYYVLGQVWRRGLGGSVMSLRLFSSLGMAVGVFGVWAALRRFFSFWATALAIATVFCLSASILFQNGDLRPYGLFVGMAGLAFWLWTRAVEAPKVSPALFMGTAACHAALVLCHPFGIVYSGLFLSGLIISDARRGRVRMRAYAAVAMGWLALLAWLGPFLRYRTIVGAGNWTEVPRWQDLLYIYQFKIGIRWFAVLAGLFVLLPFGGKRSMGLLPADRKASLVLASLLMVAAVAMQVSNRAMWVYISPGLTITALVLLAFAGADHERWNVNRPVLELSVGFLLVPAGIFFLSQISTSMFVPRYWLPSHFGLAVVLAAVFDNFAGGTASESAGGFRRSIWVTALAAILAIPLIQSVRESPTDVPLAGVSTSELEALAPPRKPIVIEDPLVFLPLTMEHGRHEHDYFYVMDRQTAGQSSANRAVVCFQTLNAWSEYGYLKGHLVTEQSFLAEHDDFLVLHAPDFAWFDARVANRTDYHARVLGQIRGSNLFEVTRERSLAPASELSRSSQGTSSSH